MEGPLGYGDPVTQRFVLPDEWLNYKIHFENITNATASACEIRVTTTLAGNLDWSTFEFSEVGLGSQTDTSFFGKKGGEVIVPLQGASYKLKMVFSLNAETGELSCYLRAWDETQADQNYLPADVLAGILPPNDDTGRGEGYVAYRVKVKAGAGHLARIDSCATIVFDANDPITTDPSWWNTVAHPVSVSFKNPDGSSVTNLSLIAGMTYGELPVLTRLGYLFGGWWTGPGGTGTRVTMGALVPVGEQTLYALWTKGNYLCDPEADSALAVVGSYDGYFYSENALSGGTASSVRGTLSLKVSSLLGKLTAKATMQKGSLSFSSATWTATATNGTRRATLSARSGETLDLYVRQYRMWGTLSGGILGGESLTLDGARNRFAERADEAAQTLLNGFRGYYTVALPAYDSLSLGTAAAAPQGVGYLAVTVGAKGSAKIAGVLADGTKVSRSSRVILFDGCGPEACVPLFAPLYMKQGWAGGLLWLDPATRAVVTDRDLGWFVRWEKPGTGPDGFRLLLEACGGFYGTGAALASAYLFTASVGEVPYHYAGGAADWTAIPEDVGVSAAGLRMAMTKGIKPVKGENGEYSYSGVNPTSATLGFASRTGIFKGKFSLYYDYNLNGTLQHKAVSVPYSGVLTPLRSAFFDDLPAGLGHCLVPDNDPAVKTYRLKRSFPVLLEKSK